MLKTEELHLFIVVEEMSFSCLGCVGGRRGNSMYSSYVWFYGGKIKWQNKPIAVCMDLNKGTTTKKKKENSHRAF